MTESRIKGSSKVLGVMGCPIEHSFSPTIHNTIAVNSGENFVYVPFRVERGNVGEAVSGAAALGIVGLNVTVPHKVEVMKYLCDVDKAAQAIGAVNTLKLTEKGYVGYNTDVIGVGYSLERSGVDIKGKKVLLLGAGGAANACAAMACEKGAAELIIANRTKEKAQALAERMKEHYACKISAADMDEAREMENIFLVMNATTVGFGDKVGSSPLQDKQNLLKTGAKVVFDAIYTPWETKLLQDASALGLKAINGFDMLIYQAVAAEEIWFDKSIGKDEAEALKNELAEHYRNEQL